MFFPFDFGNPSSNASTVVRWLLDSHGIEISSSSAIRSLAPPQRFYDALVTGDGITIEIWLATEDIHQRGPARIVSYSYNKYLRNFTIGQEGKDLILRLRTTETDLNGHPELDVKDVFIRNALQHITTTYDFYENKVYVNGKNRLNIKGYGGRFTNWDEDFNLIIGNELTGNRPWLGKIYKVAIYNRALSHQEVLQNYNAGSIVYPLDDRVAQNWYISDGLVALYIFNEGSGDIITDQSGLRPAIDLHIPKEIQIANKEFLRSPYQNYTLNFHTFKDLIANILGFIPFGFLLYMMISNWCLNTLKSIGIVLIIGILYTFSIELIQYFIKSRVSSMTDVVNNNIGISLGIIAVKLYPSIFEKFIYITQTMLRGIMNRK